MRRGGLGSVWLLAALALLSASACGGDGGGGSQAGGAPEPPRGGLKIVATTPQIAALARQVAGDGAQVRAIIPQGVEPHQFEPTAGDLAELNGADLILRHGVGLDNFLARAGL